MARGVAPVAAGMQVPALACAVPIAVGVAVLIAGGLHCLCCRGNLMPILLVVGVMDLSVMAAVTAAITIERLAPAGDRVARTVGAAAVGTAPLPIARALG